MNYPIESLAIIAPIIFIVLMIAFPVIGVFGGWKRAAYWGGGTFVFYCIGLLVWFLASGAIGGALAPLIQGLLPEAMKTADLSKLAASVVAPVFFLLWMALAELILLINYYAWFKRVVGLKKKRDAKGNKIKPKLTLKQKLINYICGGVGMGLAMVPSTISFTQVVFFTTTSAATRKNNKLASNLYNGLTGLTEKMSWFSYYGNTKSYQDYDALFAALSLTTKKITINGEEKEAYTAIVETLNEFTDVVKEVANKATEGTIGDTVNNFVDQWSQVVDLAGEDVGSLFSSENATSLLTDILGLDNPESSESTVTIAPDNLQGFLDSFDKYVEQYDEGKGKYKRDDGTIVDYKAIPTIQVTEEAFNHISDTLSGFVKLGEGGTSEQAQQLNERIKTLTTLLFEPK